MWNKNEKRQISVSTVIVNGPWSYSFWVFSSLMFKCVFACASPISSSPVMFHLSCSPRGAFILHRPHLSICALGLCLSLRCGEQGQGILLTCDSDSTLNQGQRAQGKRKKSLHKFPSHLICDFEWLRTGEQLIIREEWILAPVDAFNVFVQVLRFKTTTLIQPPSHYRQNRAVKPEDQGRNSNLISSRIFTVKMRLL